MLQKMNDYIKGWVAGVIVAMIGATFVFWGVSSYVGRSSGANAVVAKVGRYKITAQEVSKEYRTVKSNYLQSVGLATLPEQTAAQLKQYVVQQLVIQQALLQTAKKQGFAISMGQVRQFLMQDPEFQVEGKFSPQKLQYAIYNAGDRSGNSFYSGIQQKLIVNQVQAGMQLSSFILPDELATGYGLLHQARDIGYFAIPVSRFVSKATVTDAEVKAYYKENTSHYETPEQASFDYVVLDPKVMAKGIHISSAQVQQYYEDHQANYSAPKRWSVTMATLPVAVGSDQVEQQKAIQAMQALSKKSASTSADFSTLARQAGADVSSQWLSATNSIVSVAVLEGLQVGQYSAVLQTKQGLVIVRLDEVKAAAQQSLADVSDKISALLASQRLEQQMSTDTEKLSNLTYTDANSLAPAAKQLGVKVEQTELMSAQGVASGIFSDKSVLQAAFSDEVLRQNYNSQPVVLESGVVVVLRKNTEQPSRIKSLSEVSAAIKRALLADKAEQLAGVEAYHVQQALVKESSKKVASEYGLSWVAQNGVKRNDQKLPKKVRAAVFSTVLKGHDNSSYNTVLEDGIYYVLAVSNWRDGDSSEVDAKIMQALGRDLARSFAEWDYAAYVAAVHGRVKVKMYDKVLAEIK